MANSLTALFGGTFDPIHYGHLLPILSLAEEIKLSHISLLPNHIPPHKCQPQATTQQRLEMLQLAIEDYPILSIDMREIANPERERPSYTAETLNRWRVENGNEQGLVFIIGQDSLLNITTWYHWQTILNYCHLVICPRLGYSDNSNNIDLQQWIRQYRTNDINQLHQYPHGLIYFANTPLENISATEIRRRISDHENCNNLLLPKVWQYIKDNHLYGA